MFEGRRAERQRSFLKANIVFDEGGHKTGCIIRNITDLGAKIELNHAVPVPPVFSFEIPQKGKTLRARLIWRDKEFLGVEFVTDDTQMEPDQRKLRQATAENLRLKAAVANLTERLVALGQDVRLR